MKRQKHFEGYYNIKNNPWRPVIIYAIFGLAWIFFSDSILGVLVQDRDTYELIQTMKGFLYVLITSGLLYVVILYDNKRVFDLSNKLTRTLKDLEVQDNLIKTVYDHANMIIMIWDPDGVIIGINAYCTVLLGYDETIIGQNLKSIMAEADVDASFERRCDMLKKDASNKQFDMEMKSTHGVNMTIRWNDTYLAHTNDQTLIISYGVDVTKEKSNEERMYRLAYYDTRTGLKNRTKFEKDIREIVESGLPFYAYLVGIDNFKQLNEVHGHEYGNQFLLKFGLLLQSEFGEDHVYRWWGDQFVLLCHGDNGEVCHDYPSRLATLTNQKIKLGMVAYTPRISVGITRYPEDGASAKELFRNMDLALYKAKEDSQKMCVYYSKELLEDVQKVNFMGEALSRALDEDQFELFVQPQYKLDTFETVAYEILLRLPNNQVFKHIGQVIETAETTGQIYRIDQWVVEKTFSIIDQNRHKLEGVEFSINLSASTFMDTRIIEYIHEKIEQYNINPGDIVFEVTEYTAVSDVEISRLNMIKLKEMGFRIAIDDFGTQYSALNYISRLPVDILKIDKIYVDDIDTKESDMAIVELIINLCHQLGLVVVAEGIEKSSQNSKLVELGADLGQGYMFSKPFTIHQLLD